MKRQLNIARASFVLLVAYLICTVGVDALAEDLSHDWPAWRGPERTGVAPHGDPPLHWDEQTNIKWKVAIPGRGSGSPIVVGDKIFLLTAVKTDRTAETDADAAVGGDSPFRLVQDKRPRDQQGSPFNQPRPPRRRGGFGGFGGRNSQPTNIHQFNVLCLDRRSGDVLWQKTAIEAVPHEGHHGTASYASSSPVTDGKNLYVSFGSRGVYSYDLDGIFRWHQEIPPMSMRHAFGEGSSPELYGNTLVVNCDHEGQSFIIAYDTDTGRPRWKKLRDEQTTWLTPFIVEHDGVVQVVVNGMNRARGYDLQSGDVLWECGGQAQGPVPTAVAYQGLVFCMTGHRGSALFAIPLDARGDITGTDKVAWSLHRDTPYVPSPLLYGDLLYFLKSNNGILSCVKAETGEVQYAAKRLPGMDAVYSSPVGAAGRIYIAGRNGKTVVVKHGPELEVLAENQLDETIDATPAIVGREIILRGERHLYCIVEGE